MLKYRRILLCLSLAFAQFNANANPIDLAIQTGHTDKVMLVCSSKDNRFIASYGMDKKVVVWETRTASQFTSIYIDSLVQSIQFSDEDNKLFIYTQSERISFFLEDNTTSSIHFELSQKNMYVDNEIRIELYTSYGFGLLWVTTPEKIQVGDRFSSDYSDLPFTHFVYSPKNRSCYVACADGNIYVYDSTFKKKYLRGHLSPVNHLALSQDQNYLYSASDDRTIIQWDLKKEIEVNRFYGKCYATTSIDIDSSGYNLSFGNEVGQVKIIHFQESPLNVNEIAIIDGNVHFTYITSDGKVSYGGEDNIFHITSDNSDLDYKLSPITVGQLNYLIVTKVLKLYKPPHVYFKSGNVNPSGKTLVFSGGTRRKYSDFYRLANLQNGNLSKKFFATSVAKLSEPYFLNDSVFFTLDNDSIPDSDLYDLPQVYNSISFWLIQDENYQKLQHKEVFFDREFQKATKLNESHLLLLDTSGHLFHYQINRGKLMHMNTPVSNNIYYLDDNIFAISNEINELIVYEFKNDSSSQIAIFHGHVDAITSCTYHKQMRKIFTTSEDATVRIWSLDSAALLVTIIPIGGTNAIYVTPDNYYFSTSRNLNSFGFKVGMDYYYPEQFDLIYNRPDIVLTQLGYEDEELISAYKLAHEKRLQKLGYTSDSLQSDFHLPEIKIDNLSSVPHSLDVDSVILKITAYDQLLKLDRLQVWVNDVAIYGSQGISLRSLDTNLFHTDLSIPLALGGNKIQISVLNTGGAESFRSGVFVDCTSGESQAALYIVSIGCSKFIDNKFDLNYASKDALDFVSVFKNQKLYHEVHSKTLTDEQVTKENVIQLREFLAPATINDVVMVFFAGHGVLDNELNYYLAGHDMDFSQPEKRGIPYTDLESLVDGIAPLKKLVFIDACHSGELDKSEIILTDEKSVTEAGDISFRKVGNQLSQLHGISSSELSKSLFADLRKGTGATVISSASGVEFAMESDQWQNGLFTYCLIRGLTKGFADLDHNKEITVSELQLYVQDEVNRLSNGKQTPTSRMENNALNYRIW